MILGTGVLSQRERPQRDLNTNLPLGAMTQLRTNGKSKRKRIFFGMWQKASLQPLAGDQPGCWGGPWAVA